MFVSALGSITGEDNRLGFRKASRVCVVLVDGLGTSNLKFAAGHAPLLKSALAVGKTISCAFPSSTAASITSFATGLRVGEHKLIGYSVYARDKQYLANLLSGWGEQQNPQEWQPAETVSERARNLGIASFVVGPIEYSDSGFTNVTMRSATYIGAKSIADRALAAKKLLASNEKALVYLYIPELDQAAHAFGAASLQWLNRVEELDSAMRQLATGLAKYTSVILTADHGVIDVPASSQIYLDEVVELDDRILAVGGDPRATYLYLRDPDSTQLVINALQHYLGDYAWVLTKHELAQSDLFQNLQSSAKEFLPDCLVLAKKKVAFYHRKFAKPASLRMIGQHGGISPEELNVPLLIWNG